MPPEKRNYWFYGLANWFKDRFLYTTETVRARNKKGHYIKDDLSTLKNEAYITRKVKKVSAEAFLRARTKKGRFVGDDKTTSKKNEAYTKTKRKKK